MKKLHNSIILFLIFSLASSNIIEAQKTWQDYDNAIKAYEQKHSYDTCLNLVNQAILKLDKWDNEPDTIYRDWLSYKYTCLFYLQKYDESLETCKLWYEQIKKEGISDSLRLATCYSELATLYEKNNMYPEAEENYLSALRIRERELQDTNQDYIQALVNVAYFYRTVAMSQKSYEKMDSVYLKSEIYYKKALPLAAKKHGETHYLYFAVIKELADVYYGMGRYDEAMNLYSLIEQNWDTYWDADYQTNVASMENLLNIYEHYGQKTSDKDSAYAYYEKAEDIYYKLIPIYKGNSAVHKTKYFFAANNLGILYLKKADVSNSYKNRIANLQYADTAFTGVNNTMRMLIGDKSEVFASYISGIGKIFYNFRSYDKAAVYYLEAIDIYSNTNSNTELDSAIFMLCEVYLGAASDAESPLQAIEYYKKVEPLYKQLFDLRKKDPGEKSKKFKDAILYLAGLYEKIALYEPGIESKRELLNQSEIYRKKYLDIVRKSEDKSSKLYLYALKSLADLYEFRAEKAYNPELSGKDYDTAEKLFLEILQLSKEKSNKDYALALTELAWHFSNKSFYSTDKETKDKNVEKAESYFKNSIEIFEKTDSVQDYLARTYNDYALLISSKGMFEESVPIFVKSAEYCKKLYGENHPQYAIAIDNLAQIYKQIGRFGEAEDLYLKSASINMNINKGLNEKYANNLNNLSVLYYEIGEYGKAEKYIIDAGEIYLKLYGEYSRQYAQFLGNAGFMYSGLSYFEKADSLLTRAAEITKYCLGENSKDYGVRILNLAVNYFQKGDFNKALYYALESVKIYQDLFGENHPDYAMATHNLALIYNELEENKKAEEMMLKALEIEKKLYGEEHPSYAEALQNYAAILVKMGNLEKAGPMLESSAEIQRKFKGEKSTDYAGALNALAIYYTNMGELTKDKSEKAKYYSKAETNYQKASEITSSLLGTDHKNYPVIISNLAGIKRKQKKYDEAIELNLEAKRIREKNFGKDNTDYANSLNNLALNYIDLKKWDVADSLLEEAASIFEKIHGERHPDNAISVNNLAGMFKMRADYSTNQDTINMFLAKAEKWYLKSQKISHFNITKNFNFLSEKEKELYFKTISGRFWEFDSYVFKRKEANPAITTELFNNTIRNKGLLLRSGTAMRNAVLSSGDTALTNKYEKWIYTKKTLNEIYSGKENADPKKIKELEERADKIEKELVIESQMFSDFQKIQNIDWKDIQGKLKSDEAALEFISFRYFERNWTDSVFYCALLIKKDSQYPEMIYLFEENDLASKMRENVTNNYQYISSLYGKGNELYNIIWQPLESYLNGIKTVYYSPEGLLHKISFAALQPEAETFLCQNFNLVQQSSSSVLVTGNDGKISKKMNVVLFGGIDYNTDSTNVELWKYLPGTKAETDKLSELFAKNNLETNYYFGKQSSEDKFKELAPKCDLLHISTHGFFFPNPENEEKEEKVETGVEVVMRGTASGIGVGNFVKNDNPLMRSGLAFAGANAVWSQKNGKGTDDGVLTAQEISQLDLRKADLVVMSACETGLGDIRGSEGVYGLQRAFKMAGVKYMIMSLWQVADKETEEFMVIFYTNLLESKNVKTAFAEAQNEMRKKYAPYYWAAFVLVE